MNYALVDGLTFWMIDYLIQSMIYCENMYTEYNIHYGILGQLEYVNS